MAKSPFLGMLSGYLFNPAYLVSELDETVVLRMQKQPAFLESKFIIEKKAELSGADEQRALLSLVYDDFVGTLTGINRTHLIYEYKNVRVNTALMFFFA